MLLTYIVSHADNDKTVYSVLRRELRISATMLRRLKKADAIVVSGKSVFTNYKLSAGEVVEVDISAAEPLCDNLPEDGKVDVLFENDGLLAVNKPSGILVHPSRARHTGTLSNFVAGYLQDKRAVYLSGHFKTDEPAHGIDPSCHAVNRLDRDTSGVVLFAKNSYMKSLASDALSSPDTKKEYLALTFGEMPERGVIDAPIIRFEERNMLRIVSPEGQRAVTYFETLGIIGAGERSFSLVKLRLETGRTHQIRVHCLHIGHPILGDRLYSSDQSSALSRDLGVETQALHAQTLAFSEPLTGQRIEIRAPWSSKNYACILPQDMLAYLS
ncbi:MAG: RluA family pseudouridine synthase [Oscillospiraceae bacterium]|nr:RluA family pseudouridine synthase [Oscillospiraceae bacterium]